jgi:hypothetical protein
VFAEIKDDHPVECPDNGSDIETANRWELEILAEVSWYGLTQLPDSVAGRS